MSERALTVPPDEYTIVEVLKSTINDLLKEKNNGVVEEREDALLHAALARIRSGAVRVSRRVGDRTVEFTQDDLDFGCRRLPVYHREMPL